MPEASITTDSLTDYRYICQANYKDTRLALIKTVMLFFCRGLSATFCSLGYFQTKIFLNVQEFYKTYIH